MKKVIKIAHLYYDIMNLYGENGNIEALVKFIERQGVKAEVYKFSLGERIDFRKYDFFYMGSGSEENEVLVLADMYERKDDIKDAIENDKMFLVSGNAMELFGGKIMTRSGRDIACLGIFDYNALEASKRIVGELTYEFEELDEGKGRKIIGFKNCKANIVNNDENRPFKMPDNIHYKNFFGMSFFGPVLIRNPYFTDYLLKILFEELDFEYKQDDSSIEYVAYHEYIKNFIENSNLD